MKSSIALLLFICCYSVVTSQKATYKVACVGFYNFENLFDTEEDPNNPGDDEFMPGGKKNWNPLYYQEKLGHLAQVVSELAQDITPDGLAILGTAEVENKKVLEDFVKQEAIKDRNYQIVHYDSPDHRGIDVALLYQPKYFTLISSEPVSMKDAPDNENGPFLTRDILHVKGILDGDTVHILVNHWPSRSGGESATAHLRAYAAGQNLAVIEKIKKTEQNPKVIIMGDLNDDPNSPSIKKVLKASVQKEKTAPNGFFNPMNEFFQKGIGTLAWRDSWNLFDQIILSVAFIQESNSGYHFYQAKVFNKKYLTQTTGQYQGYPFRTFVGDTYVGGYSDHFPVYIVLLKPK